METIRQGTTIGSWRILRPLGRGAMGAVFLAEDHRGTRVALKLLTLGDDRSRGRFHREWTIGKRIQHPNVIRILDGGEFQGLPFLVMEFIEGNDLGAISKARGRLAPGQVLELARQLGAGLEALHREDLVHRDLKPDNLMIDRAGVLRIMDLGLIRDPDSTALTKTGSLVGTPWYMAPEQVLGHAATPRTDLFAFGLILYCLLTGRHPFRHGSDADFLQYLRRLTSTDPRPWHPQGIGGPLDLFFGKALSRQPEARFGSGQELAVAFEQALVDQARGTHRSVEETLEMEVDDSGVGAFEDLELPPDQVPATPVPTFDTGSPEEGRRPLWILAALAGIPLFLLSVFWESLHPEQVLVISCEGLRGTEGSWLLVRTDGPAELRLGSEAARIRSEDGCLHLLALPENEGPLALRTRRGTTVLERQLQDLTWWDPPLLRRSWDASGGLMLGVRRPEPGRLSLRRPGGVAIVDSSTDEGFHRFRIADPGGVGAGRLEVWFELEGGAIPWTSLPPLPSLGEELERLAGALEAVDPVLWMKDAGRGTAAAESLRRRLEKSGLPAVLEDLRPQLERLVAPGAESSELRDRIVTRLSALMVMEAYFLAAGTDSPFGLFDTAIGDGLWSCSYYGDRPQKPIGASWISVMHQDLYQITDSPYTPSQRDPTALFVRPFGEPTLSPLPGPRGDHWLGIHTSDWQAGFFAEVWVNDRGPFWVSDDPRFDRRAHWDASLHPDGTCERRLIRVKVPSRVLGLENRVRLVMRPWAFLDRVLQVFLIVHALTLEPCR